MTGGMDGAAREVAEGVDRALQERELALLRRSRVDWDALRPESADAAIYARLQQAVQSATAHNESLAQLEDRISALGSEGIALAREVLRSLVPA